MALENLVVESAVDVVHVAHMVNEVKRHIVALGSVAGSDKAQTVAGFGAAVVGHVGGVVWSAQGDIVLVSVIHGCEDVVCCRCLESDDFLFVMMEDGF